MCAQHAPTEPTTPRQRITSIQWVGLAALVLLLLYQFGIFSPGGAGLFSEGPEFFIPFLLAIVLAVTVHEFSHAWVATLFGDDLPRRMGRLTLNPIAHLDLLGSLLFLVAQFGWGKPVPINPGAMTNPNLGWALSSVAGPVSNFVAATVASLVVHSGVLAGAESAIVNFVILYIVINITLGVFNLVPLPPLDGFGFVFGLSPRAIKVALLPIQTFGPWILLALIFLPRLVPGAPPILGIWINSGTSFVLNLLGIDLRAF